MNKPAVGEVGRPVPQLEAQEKVCGSAQSIADLYSPKMLYGAVLQSPHAHARILNYDLSQALAISGVRAIVTGDDLQDAWRMGAFIKDEHALAKGKVRYIGEAVAAVAADTEAIAGKAAAAIVVAYDELPASLSPEQALSPGAAIIHEQARVHKSVRYRYQWQSLFAHELPRRRHRSGLAQQRSRFRRPLSDPGAGSCLARALRRTCRNRRQRPHHTVVCEPVGFASRPTSPSRSACRCRGFVA